MGFDISFFMEPQRRRGHGDGETESVLLGGELLGVISGVALLEF